MSPKSSIDTVKFVAASALRTPASLVGTAGKLAQTGLAQVASLVPGRERTEAAEAAPAPTEAPAEKAPEKKAPAKKPAAKQAPASKSAVKKAPATKAPAKKAPATKTAAKKAPAKKAPAKKAAPAAAARAGEPTPVDVVAELGLDPAPVAEPKTPKTPPVTQIDAEATPELHDATPADLAAKADEASVPTED